MRRVKVEVARMSDRALAMKLYEALWLLEHAARDRDPYRDIQALATAAIDIWVELRQRLAQQPLFPTED